MDWNSQQEPSGESWATARAAIAKWAEQEYDTAYENYFAGDWAAAEAHAKAAVDACPSQAHYRLLLAQSYCAMNRLNLAWSELLILKQQDPKNAGAKSLEHLLQRKMDDSGAQRKNAKTHRSFIEALASIFGA
jgi:predicted Zn-dependent protease